MNLSQLTLFTVQFTAIGSFIAFMAFVFLRKIRSSSSLRKYFFQDKKMVIEFVIFFVFYVFLFTHLFIYNGNHTILPIYIFGSLLALIGLIIAFIGRIQLRTSWTPITMTDNQTKVVNKGIFGILRHPIYIGRFLFFSGVMFMLNPYGLSIAVLYWFFLRKKSVEEEQFLNQATSSYKTYAKKVKSGFF